MTRVKAVFRPEDYPGTPDPQTKAELAELFAHLFPGKADPEIDLSHAGVAIAALNPKLALNLATLSEFIALEMPWCHRADLRELAIQALNLHFKCDFAFQARLPNAQAAGIGAELLAAIPYWRTSPMFNEEQRLVVEYTNAVVVGDVPEGLFARVSDIYGEKGAVEFTAAVAWWSFWAMLLNATGPKFDPIS
jgi:alkylhydroperoxidase family enzyme